MADMSSASPASLLRAYVYRYFGDKGENFDNWTLYLGKIPATPDQAIAFIDQSGPAGYPNLLVDFPGLQVLVRGAKGGDGYNTSWLMIRKIRDALLGTLNAPPEFLELDGITERGHIVPLGYDEFDRHVWSSNYQLTVEPGANALTHRASL